MNLNKQNHTRKAPKIDTFFLAIEKSISTQMEIGITDSNPFQTKGDLGPEAKRS